MDGFQKGKGIEDFGNFNEGFCFKLNLIRPTEQIFVICTNVGIVLKENIMCLFLGYYFIAPIRKYMSSNNIYKYLLHLFVF